MIRQEGQKLLDAIAHFLHYGEEYDFKGRNYEYWKNAIIIFNHRNNINIGIKNIETQKELRIAGEAISEKLNEGASVAEAPKQPEQTVPDKEVLDQEEKQEEEKPKRKKVKKEEDIYKKSIERAEEVAKEKAKAKADAEAQAKSQAEAAVKIKNETEVKVKEDAANLVEKEIDLPKSTPEQIYVTPEKKAPVISLDNKQAQALLADINEAVEKPGKYAAELTEKSLKQPETQAILSKFEPEAAKKTVHTEALKHTENLRALDKSLPVDPKEKLQALFKVSSKFSPTTLTAGLANPNDPQLIKLIPDSETRLSVAKSAQNIALGSAGENDLAQAFFAKLNYPIAMFYPTAIVKTNLSLAPYPNSFQINTRHLIQAGNNLESTYQERRDDDGSFNIGLDDIKQVKRLSKYIDRDWNSVLKNFNSRGWQSIKSFFGDIKFAITGEMPSSLTAAGSESVLTSGRIAFSTTDILASYWSSGSVPYLGMSTEMFAQIPAATAFPTLQIGAESTALVTQITTPYAALPAEGVVISSALGAAEPVTAAALTASATVGAEAVAVGTAGTGAAAGTAIATTAAGTTAAAGTGVAAGTLGSLATPIVGAIVAAVTAVLTFIATVVLPWAAKHWKKIALLTLITAGVVFTPLLFIPAGLFAGYMLATGGSTAASIGSSMGVFFTAVLAFFVGSFLIPAIIILLVIPIIIIFVLFIINSGAYVVPPGIGGPLAASTQVDIESPWIGVEKTANKTAYSNANLASGFTVSYTVRVWAKKSSLTNIVFQNDCSVRKEGSSPTCTHPTPETDGDDSTNTPTTLTPGDEDYVFSYDVVYNNLVYEDSFITDTFSVTADTEDKSGALATSSVSIKIGEPPSDCPFGWPLRGNIVIIQGPGGAFSHVGLEALDFLAPRGTPVYVTHSGTVSRVREGVNAGFGSGYGNFVEVKSTCETTNGNIVNFSSIYSHFLSVNSGINVGAPVSFGQQLGTVNDTGRSTTDHLHYEFKGLKMERPYVDYP